MTQPILENVPMFTVNEGDKPVTSGEVLDMLEDVLRKLRQQPPLRFPGWKDIPEVSLVVKITKAEPEKFPLGRGDQLNRDIQFKVAFNKDPIRPTPFVDAVCKRDHTTPDALLAGVGLKNEYYECTLIDSDHERSVFVDTAGKQYTVAAHRFTVGNAYHGLTILDQLLSITDPSVYPVAANIPSAGRLDQQ